MNRRGFLGLLGAATAISAGGILVPQIEKARTFFLPPRSGWCEPIPILYGMNRVPNSPLAMWTPLTPYKLGEVVRLPHGNKLYLVTCAGTSDHGRTHLGDSALVSGTMRALRLR